jgi:hypothetical protein
VTEPEALAALLGASTLAEAREAVRALTGSGAFAWRPLGDKEGNFGLVNIGSEPGLAFVERVTNALDAVVDLAAVAAAPEVRADLESPRDAARRLFAIPEGRLTHLDEAAAGELASRVVVRTQAGSARGSRPSRCPTRSSTSPTATRSTSRISPAPTAKAARPRSPSRPAAASSPRRPPTRRSE